MYTILFVCIMGVGTVFVGLSCLILLTIIMSKVFQEKENAVLLEKKDSSTTASNIQESNAGTDDLKEAIQAEFIAAISVVIAEELGSAVSKIRIVSMKKIKGD